MTTGDPTSEYRRPGVFRGLVPNTIYLTVGGFLAVAPVAGAFALASVIISTVMLTTSPTNIPSEDVTAVRVSLIVLASLIGLVTLILCFFLGRLHRSRATNLLLAHIPAPKRRRRGWKRFLTLGVTLYGLRMLAYHVIGVLWGPLMVLIVLVCLLGGPAAVIYFSTFDGTLPEINTAFTIAAIVLTLGTPWILYAVTRVDLAFVHWVNGVNEKAVLAQRVQQVTQSRSDVVAAADAERRRIERNLHDGAQQRLTALTVKLGIERSRHRHAEASGQVVDAQTTQEALQYAQEELQTALQEIRHLVRGLHPAVLEDRGLDAAISGIASRTSLPVEVDINVPERPSLDVEAVAYFVISEAINNVIAHADAQQVSVTVLRSGDTLEILVEDDGVGGADEHSGTGLTGLRRRVESIDGSLRMSSTAEHGTTIQVELPCA